MSFRTKLFAAVVLAVGAVAVAVSWSVSAAARGAFEQLDEQRTLALVAQFRREFRRQGEEVVRRLEGAAASEAAARAAIELARADPDLSPYVQEAKLLAESHGLDFLEMVGAGGVIISSAHWPARFGYPSETILRRETPAVLERIALPEEQALGLVAVRLVRARDRTLYLHGGQRLDRQFLDSLTLPPGLRVLLHQERQEAAPPPEFAPLIEEVRLTGREVRRFDSLRFETLHAIPLSGRDGALLAVLLVGSTRRELAALTNFIGWMGAAAGAAGLLLGVLLSWWVTTRVTRPVTQLAEGAGEVASGNWSARVDAGTRDEIGDLARAFNRMTEQLVEHRDRLVQAERVAAWRELARRLAHELKNPLFPLQITVENLQRAKQAHPREFEEVFRESTATLLAELNNLKAIIGRFSDFARMPAPRREPVSLNEIARGVLRLFEAQFGAPGRPAIRPEAQLDEGLGEVNVDPELMHRALQNLVLNAMDAMPRGGTLTIRTGRHDGFARIEVSDTGGGLTREECERLFTPYFTSKQHGTGLGLAVVQSVVSDHGGRISVESEPGRGTTFRIDLVAD